MGTKRDIRRSQMEHLRQLFENPPADSGLAAYHVYNESELREVQAKKLKPEFPWLFLVDAYTRPVAPTLPLLVVETTSTQRPFELGNTKGRRTVVRCHVFGRMRGERDDLGSFIVDNLGAAIPIYHYDASGSASFVENGVVVDQIDEEDVTSSEALRQEGTLDLWQIVTYSLHTQQ